MSARVWFRTEEIHPIAEHAIACHAHRLTEAQVRARFPLRPALIRTGTATPEILQSNGAAGLYSERGTIHAAEAHTWRHTATGPLRHRQP